MIRFAFQKACVAHCAKNGLWRGKSGSRWRVVKSSLNLVVSRRAVRSCRWTCWCLERSWVVKSERHPHTLCGKGLLESEYRQCLARKQLAHERVTLLNSSTFYHVPTPTPNLQRFQTWVPTRLCSTLASWSACLTVTVLTCILCLHFLILTQQSSLFSSTHPCCSWKAGSVLKAGPGGMSLRDRAELRVWTSRVGENVL